MKRLMRLIRSSFGLLAVAIVAVAPAWAGVTDECFSIGEALSAAETPDCCALSGTDRVVPEGGDCCGVVGARADQAPVQPTAVLAQVPGPLLAVALASVNVSKAPLTVIEPSTYAARAPPPHLRYHRSIVLRR